MPERTQGPGKGKRPFQILFPAGAALLLWPMAVAWAEPATIDVFTSTRYSDNMNRNETDRDSDFENRVGFSINKTTDPGRCQGSTAGDVAFLNYPDNSNDDELSANLDASGQCQPQRNIRWNANATVRDVRSTTRVAESPDNQESRYVVSTGPTLMANPSSRDDLSLDLEYEVTRFEDSTEDDSDRVTATGRWQRILSLTLSGGLTVSASDIDFRNTNETLERTNANVFFTWERRNGQLEGQFGVSRLESEQGPTEDETSGFTGELRYSHQWQGGTSGFAEVRREITDVSTDLDVRIPGLDLNLTETSSVTISSLSAGLSKEWTPRMRSDLNLSYNRQEFERTGDEEDRSRADLTLSRQVTSNLSARLTGGYEHEEFEQDNTDTDTIRTELGLDYQRTRDLSFNAAIGREDRTVDGPGSEEFEENWIRVGFRYNLR